MTTTASLRSTVKDRLVTIGQAVLPQWQVSYGPPDKPLRELVVFHDVRTNEERMSAMTGADARKPSFDFFTVEGIIGARQIGQSCKAGEQRVEVAYDTLKNALVDPSVAGPNLYGAGTYAAIVGLQYAWLRPGDLLSDKGEQGFESTLTFFVDCHTRLT